MAPANRREFVQSCAAAMAWTTSQQGFLTADEASQTSGEEFASYQERRRKKLWSLLGDLPWQHPPAPPRLLKTENHEGYTLERLVLDLNGVDPVPAMLLCTYRRPSA